MSSDAQSLLNYGCKLNKANFVIFPCVCFFSDFGWKEWRCQPQRKKKKKSYLCSCYFLSLKDYKNVYAAAAAVVFFFLFFANGNNLRCNHRDNLHTKFICFFLCVVSIPYESIVSRNVNAVMVMRQSSFGSQSKIGLHTLIVVFVSLFLFLF